MSKPETIVGNQSPSENSQFTFTPKEIGENLEI
jgi:hypothetical protein